MHVSGELIVTAPRSVVFDALSDAAAFVKLVDGVDDVRQVDPTHFAAMFETRIAYMKFKFAVTVELTRIDAPNLIEAKIEGNALGVVGRLTARSTTTLIDAGDATKVVYTVESTLAGKLGSIGQPVLRAKAKDMQKAFADRLRATFAPSAEQAG
jgi:carbon monoxide dehydrogenase subunit G